LTPLPQLSLGLKPFWGADQGAIALTRAAWPIIGFRTAMFKILLRRIGAGLAVHGFTSYRSDRFDLSHDGPVMIDGEVLPVGAGGGIGVSATQPLGFLR
ncbi:MAG: hypothetical protein U1D06_08210, partial [Paracoccaceae bacterium]|nr:hypothetical protein [Paracoccaceae bacterium]